MSHRYELVQRYPVLSSYREVLLRKSVCNFDCLASCVHSERSTLVERLEAGLRFDGSNNFRGILAAHSASDGSIRELERTHSAGHGPQWTPSSAHCCPVLVYYFVSLRWRLPLWHHAALTEITCSASHRTGASSSPVRSLGLTGRGVQEFVLQI